MTLQEFTDRTGFYPDKMLFEEIEAHRRGDVDAFCKAYKENANGLAEKIQHKADVVYTEMLNLNRLAARLRKTVKALTGRLEWKPANLGTNLDQYDYEDLAEDCTSMDGELKAMSESEAKRLVAEEFGFSADKVEIVEAVHDYEINIHGDLRESAEYRRLPLYESADRNYIRFDVRCVAAVRHYEMIDGELEEYFA